MPTTPRLTAELVTRTDLRQVRTPPSTRTWQPLPHATLLDQVCPFGSVGGRNYSAKNHSKPCVSGSLWVLADCCKLAQAEA